MWVTGVQTCALPICGARAENPVQVRRRRQHAPSADHQIPASGRSRSASSYPEKESGGRGLTRRIIPDAFIPSAGLAENIPALRHVRVWIWENNNYLQQQPGRHEEDHYQSHRKKTTQSWLKNSQIKVDFHGPDLVASIQVA